MRRLLGSYVAGSTWGPARARRRSAHRLAADVTSMDPHFLNMPKHSNIGLARIDALPT